MLVVFHSFQLWFEMSLYSSWIVQFAGEIMLVYFAKFQRRAFSVGFGIFFLDLFHDHSASFKVKEPGDMRLTELSDSLKCSSDDLYTGD